MEESQVNPIGVDAAIAPATTTTTTTSTSQQRIDGPFLHFLKELPAWCVLVTAFAALLSMWYVTGGNDYLGRLLDQAFAALTTAVVINRLRPGQSTGASSSNTIENIEHVDLQQPVDASNTRKE